LDGLHVYSEACSLGSLVEFSDLVESQIFWGRWLGFLLGCYPGKTAQRPARLLGFWWV